MEIEVKGHSGCRIDIIKENNNIYLEKSTFDPKYVKRLYNQAIKQKKRLARNINTSEFQRYTK